jgi:2-oxoisovalerate dehydrogenase E1 component
MEPKALYNSPNAASVVPDDFEVPFGKAVSEGQAIMLHL